MMTLATDISLDEQQHIVLDDMSWDFYERLLEEIGNQHIRVTYCDGSLEIMSPLPEHEQWSRRIGSFIQVLCMELNIPMTPSGSTTFRDKQKEKGLEPDESFYVKHWQAAHDMEGPWDAKVNPPADLAIEIDITRRSIAKQPIYAALGVAELWRFDGKRLQVLGLTPDGRYEAREASLAFPFLPMSEFERFLSRFKTEKNHTAVVRAFQQWVRSLPQ